MMLKKVIKKILGIKNYIPKDEMLNVLQNISYLNPSIVFDLGAAEGNWTKNTQTVWPNAKFILFEPLIEQEDGLIKLCKANSSLIYVKGAAGAKKDSMTFSVSEDLDGSGFYGTGNLREVDIFSLDDIYNQYQLEGTCFLKFDTHGFEVPILLGAIKTLEKTVGILMECYNFNISPTAFRLEHMIALMETYGFRLFDMVNIMKRPKDQALWQCDLLFLKSNHPTFSNNSYH